MALVSVRISAPWGRTDPEAPRDLSELIQTLCLISVVYRIDLISVNGSDLIFDAVGALVYVIYRLVLVPAFDVTLIRNII